MPVGDRLMWAARHGYSAYFMRTFNQRDCQPEEALTEALAEIIAAEGHVQLFKLLLASEKVITFPPPSLLSSTHDMRSSLVKPPPLLPLI